MAMWKHRRQSESDAESYVSRRSSLTYRGEMLQMRLLRMDEKYRSHFLYEQIEAFEDKVYKSFDQFNVDTMYRMLVSLSKHTVADIRKLKTVAALRQSFNDLKELKRCKLRHRHVKTTPEEEKLTNYFTWFFKYLDYIRLLRDNFFDRIYTPLFEYFYPITYDQPDRENSSDSVISSPSVMSVQSMDSGYSGLSGLSTVIADGDNWSINFTPRSGRNETKEARRRLVMKQALVALGREFQDIKKLYDTTEIEQLAHRLSHLRDRTDHLLDYERTLAPELFGQDSEKPVFDIKIADKGNEKVVRLIPDILLKFQKEAWLARRWLEKDEEKTKDLNAKLEKLTRLEENMNKRLYALSKEIQLKEIELESNAELLNNLLKREDRAINLGQNVYDMRKNKDILMERLKVLNSERGHYCEKMTKAYDKQDKKTYRRLKPLYEKNKIQRFAVERQIATLNYHIDLTEADMNIEIDVKTEVIHTTNDVQDRCEEIEERLEKAKKEQKALQSALIPIGEDRRHVKEKLQLQKSLPPGDSRPAHMAEFVNSIPNVANNPDRIVDLNGEFLGNASLNEAFPVLIASLPAGGNKVPTVQISKPSRLPISLRTTKTITNKSSSISQPVAQPIKTMDSVKSVKPGQHEWIPEVMASEW
ncbi:hypothetical protein ACF0H5_018881 [Mactra antiquata]